VFGVQVEGGVSLLGIIPRSAVFTASFTAGYGW
jgi:hypothetical protein